MAENEKKPKVGTIILGIVWIVILLTGAGFVTVALILDSHVWFFAGLFWCFALFLSSLIIGSLTKAI